MTDSRLPFELGWVGLENTVFEGENNAYVLGTEPGATTALVDAGVVEQSGRRFCSEYDEMSSCLLRRWRKWL